MLPHFPGGDLFHKLKSRFADGLPEHTVQHVLSSLVEGLLYMKSLGVAHG